MSKLLCCLVAVVSFTACGGSDAGPGTADSATPQTTVGTISGAPDLKDSVVAVDSLSTDHVDPPVSFSMSPSFGGAHYPFWQNCGFYNIPVIEGAATHSLEHGVVWITYNVELLTDAELDELREMASANDRLLISPYDQADPLILTAWGAQRSGGDMRPGDANVDSFIDQWQDNPELAEAGARCSGAAGFPPDDVRTLESGEVAPEEYI
ncbi:MAG: DUF3105 domain-containing protein [Acidimicrobiales bacterium]|nr:DUF3105 domain-containing protein [Acidimicrobiales bacterium]RZV48009.1 MAG: DUF3105 domain-containing protein [Acidimicrobiales bacterium]